MDGQAHAETRNQERHIGRRLRMGRLWHGLTPEQLAEHVRLPVDALSGCEAGRGSIEAGQLLRISQHLGLSPDYFFQELAAGITRCDLSAHE